MASAALPPGFPAVEIDREFYWDGGIHSNTPLEVLLEAQPAAETLCFVIDCFGGNPFVPTTLDEVSERAKDIGYSTHARRAMRSYLNKQHAQIKLREIATKLKPADRCLIDELLINYSAYPHTLAHICYSSRLHRGSGKDYNFGHTIVQRRMDIGYEDGRAMLAESEQWNHPSPNGMCQFYEAPNNLTRLMREGDLDEVNEPLPGAQS
jgi:NTE family protein